MLEQRRRPNTLGEVYPCRDLYRDPWNTRPSDQLVAQAKAQLEILRDSATKNVQLIDEWRHFEPGMVVLCMPIVRILC